MKRFLRGTWTGGGILSAMVLVAFVLVSCAGADQNGMSSQSSTSMAKVAMNPCNPCAAKAKANPCNPCAAKAQMNPCNPCAAKARMNPCNPCAATSNPCNPCNPCGAGSKVHPQKVSRPAGTQLPSGNQAVLVAEGKRLWEDRTLGNSGLACSTCHINFGNLKASFTKPYPHHVDMVQQRAGLEQVDLDEMVQFCMVVPMASEPLGWESRQLAALTAYAQTYQQEFKQAAAANPCMLKQTTANPCNPCNPCAAKMNPCNPCAAKNPCNPCGKKTW